MNDLSIEELRTVLIRRHGPGNSGGVHAYRHGADELESVRATPFAASAAAIDEQPSPEIRPLDFDDPIPHISSEEIYGELRLRQKSIYGEDDRVEVVRSTNPERRRLAKSVAAVLPRSRLQAVASGRVGIGSMSLSARYEAKGKPLCGREAFRSQPSVAVGTAFLVAPSIVATAHHVVNAGNYAHHCVVFDYEVDANGDAPPHYAREQVVGFKRVLGGVEVVDGEDWALVELDHALAGREPLTLRRSGSAPDMAPLYVIGHPTGLPKKIAGNAEIRDNSPASYFVANLDTYGGSSGSPVFNAITNEVEGILARGEADFVPMGDCYASLICPVTGCRGEHCSRIAPAVDLLRTLT